MDENETGTLTNIELKKMVDGLIETNKKLTERVESFDKKLNDENHPFNKPPENIQKPAEATTTNHERENGYLKTVLKAHNIEFDPSKVDHSKEFKYEAPALTNQMPGFKHTPGKEITMDDVKKMTPEQINTNWKEVSAVLETQK